MENSFPRFKDTFPALLGRLITIKVFHQRYVAHLYRKDASNFRIFDGQARQSNLKAHISTLKRIIPFFLSPSPADPHLQGLSTLTPWLSAKNFFSSSLSPILTATLAPRRLALRVHPRISIMHIALCSPLSAVQSMSYHFITFRSQKMRRQRRRIRI